MITDDGYVLVTLQNGVGAWCGYLGLPTGHRWHGLDYRASELLLVDVHGGLTYARPDPPGDTLLLLALSSQEIHVSWWLGFDCAHAGDHVPGLAGVGGGIWSTGTRVWTAETTMREVEGLLAQARFGSATGSL